MHRSHKLTAGSNLRIAGVPTHRQTVATELAFAARLLGHHGVRWMLRLLILMMLDAADKALKDLMMIDALSLSCANEHIPILRRVTTAKKQCFSLRSAR